MNREQQIEAVLARAWRTQMEKSQRLSRLAHDGISQQVAALRLGLASLTNRAEQSAPQEIVTELRQLNVAAGELMTSVSLLVDELQPPMLHTLGLESAVRWKVHRAERELGIPVHGYIEPVSLSAELATLLFEILSQALDNIRRHAQAKNVEVRLEEKAGEVRLAISDDGRGFDAVKCGVLPGLLQLQWLAAAAGGKLNIASKPGKGSRLEVSVPVEERPSDESGTENAIRVLIADDHPIVRRGLRQVLVHAGMNVEEVSTIPALRAYLAKRKPDVLVLDVNMPGGNGIEMVGEIKREDARLPVLVVSVHKEQDAGVRAMLAGAKGYLNKDTEPETLVEAVQKLHQGGRYVSPELSEALADYVGHRQGGADPHLALSVRELTVLKMIAGGRSTVEIADELHVSPKTVATYRGRIIEKMHMKSTADLTRYVIEKGLQ